ncbi:MAG: sigma-70 family RNA polymerase sigma factor [Actinomycetota bacterium]
MRARVEPDVTDAWNRFRADGDRAARDELILQYLPLVRIVARRTAALLPRGLDVDDLVSDGTFGLVDAIDRFDPSRGLAFSTFAVGRVRGAMLDGLRALDWVPRSVRAGARAMEAAIESLERSLGRPPSEAEIAERLGISPEECRRLRAQVDGAVVVPLVGEEGGADDERPELADADAARSEDRVLLTAAIDGLPEREALVVRLHDLLGVTLLEVAGMLGVSHSRAFQIHERALRLLRDAVEERDDGR